MTLSCCRCYEIVARHIRIRPYVCDGHFDRPLHAQPDVFGRTFYTYNRRFIADTRHCVVSHKSQPRYAVRRGILLFAVRQMVSVKYVSGTVWGKIFPDVRTGRTRDCGRLGRSGRRDRKTAARPDRGACARVAYTAEKRGCSEQT